MTFGARDELAGAKRIWLDNMKKGNVKPTIRSDVPSLNP
jgi:hypothetical protein